MGKGRLGPSRRGIHRVGTDIGRGEGETSSVLCFEKIRLMRSFKKDDISIVRFS